MKTFTETGMWYIEEEIAYACSVYNSAILKIDMINKKVYLYGEIQDNRRDDYLYDGCFKYKDNIWCIPSYTAKKICIFNYESKSKKNIVIDNEIYGGGLRALGYIVVGNVLYMISLETNTLYGINLDTCQIIIKKQPPNGLQLSKSLFENNGHIYVLCTGSCKIMDVDIISGAVSMIIIPEVDDLIGIMLFGEKKISFVGMDKCIYVCSVLGGKLNRLAFPDGFNYGEYKDDNNRYIFSEAIIVGGVNWYIPYHSKQLLYLDLSCNLVQMLDITESIPDLMTKDDDMWGIDYRIIYVKENRYIGLFVLREGTIIEIDTETKKTKRMEYDIDGNIYELFRKKILNEKNVFEKKLFWNMILHS